MPFDKCSISGPDMPRLPVNQLKQRGVEHGRDHRGSTLVRLMQVNQVMPHVQVHRELVGLDVRCPVGAPQVDDFIGDTIIEVWFIEVGDN